ncbi:DUF572-domain-containing protein [Rhizodiscina lignyota]|uniref:Splicing factor YJU2 n=1 Tax=Rhizodiscina lignyota TaxID=1504668 RepID=A0A9P4IB59_9PEZI|nr:DUF572-domain-containing protein [Rhizodiscina lignyota]
MSERKVLTKYYPPDFDPSQIKRVRRPKDAGVKQIPVRLMAPFSMKCTACGEYIYKGRKFNAKKETTEERYYSIPIYRFYIKCVRCSAEITFKTDPKHMDYECERGARRNFEPWRESKLAEETEEERLDRLEREEAEKDVMQDLEAKALDAKTEMEIENKLDEIQMRNAGRERAAKGDVELAKSLADERRAREEKEDEEAARRAFASGLGEEEILDGEDGYFDDEAAPPTDPVPSFKRVVKKKKDYGTALGIKKKKALVSYDSD